MKISGENLHQGAFACAIFPQDSLNGTGRDVETDARVGVYLAEMFVDIAQFDFHELSSMKQAIFPMSMDNGTGEGGCLPPC
jgi:hypothetical protein